MQDAERMPGAQTGRPEAQEITGAFFFFNKKDIS